MLETGLTADLAIVKAWKGDTEGNLVYRKTARNFNPMMATAGQVTVAEVEDLVEPGTLDPDQIHTPGIYVQRIIQGRDYQKRIEQRTVRKRERADALDPRATGQARRRELRDGYYVNLGIGIPTLVANYIPAGMKVVLQSENGMLGMGPFPYEGEEDPGSDQCRQADDHRAAPPLVFLVADSFAMIRGGHIDLSVLGAMEVSEHGDLANWMVPGKMVKGMGGAWIWSPACAAWSW